MRAPRLWTLLGTGLWGVLALAAGPPPARSDPAGEAPSVTALGRLEPRDGPIRVAGSSEPAAVIAELHVEEGDRVEKGQVLATLDRFAVRSALLRQREAELERAQVALRRATGLSRGMAGAESAREDAAMEVKAATARRDAARAELELSLVRSPIDGRVLAVHARPGERVGEDGILELGRTDEMFAVAEVYETDIGRVRVGQHAVVTSPALAEPISGSVERIGLQIGKLDVLDTDPVARTDARVVEVQIRLDHPEKVAALTYLQVGIELLP